MALQGIVMASTPKARIGIARQAARLLLERHKITEPPVPVHDIAAAEGLTVRERPWGKDYPVSGLLFRDRKLVVLNADHSPLRRRFSLAHELGHYALHHHLIRAELTVIDIDHPPDGAEAHGDVVLESEANAFAGELLVPRSLLLRHRAANKPSEETGSEPFNSPFASLGKALGTRNKPLSETELAKLFDVSREVLFIALNNHRLL
jgi:Zn-dependent peptidase ImmA (M78 family)